MASCRLTFFQCRYCLLASLKLTRHEVDFYFSVVRFAVVMGVSASLSFDKCRRKRSLHLESSLRCGGNLVKDVCGCYECVKQLNKSCGRLWNYGGTCDVGLMCQYSSVVTLHPGVCTTKGIW